jgi:2-hydroxy-3-keto-5-methylthiopentenyl-1-phosphate phosphatase
MKRICFVDFDATITEQDTLVFLLDHLVGRKAWEPIEEKIRSGKITNRVGLREEMKLCQIDQPNLTQLLKKNISIDPTFKLFVDFSKEKALELLVLSGGFGECIEPVFKKYGIELPYFANELIFGKAYLDVRYPYASQGCGDCSHCKAFHLERYKRRGYFTIFVGNGTTDRCPAKAADLVFAKDSLATYCLSERISFKPFDRFSEIQEALS